MRKPMMLAAALAASLTFASVPAAAQNTPLDPGGYMEVTEVMLEDGGGMAYANFLASTWRKNQEFAKSKGWISDYKIYSNVFARDGEPNMFLVIYYNKLPDAAEDMKRAEAMRAFQQQTDTQLVAASGERAKIRHIGGTMLLQEMRFR